MAMIAPSTTMPTATSNAHVGQFHIERTVGEKCSGDDEEEHSKSEGQGVGAMRFHLVTSAWPNSDVYVEPQGAPARTVRSFVSFGAVHAGAADVVVEYGGVAEADVRVHDDIHVRPAG